MEIINFFLVFLALTLTLQVLNAEEATERPSNPLEHLILNQSKNEFKSKPPARVKRQYDPYYYESIYPNYYPVPIILPIGIGGFGGYGYGRGFGGRGFGGRGFGGRGFGGRGFGGGGFGGRGFGGRGFGGRGFGGRGFGGRGGGFGGGRGGRG